MRSVQLALRMQVLCIAVASLAAQVTSADTSSKPNPIVTLAQQVIGKDISREAAVSKIRTAELVFSSGDVVEASSVALDWADSKPPKLDDAEVLGDLACEAALSSGDHTLQLKAYIGYGIIVTDQRSW